MLSFVRENETVLNEAIDVRNNELFQYFGLRTVYDRYLIKHPQTRQVIETPQYFFMRVACAVSDTLEDALELYRLFSSLEYLTSSNIV